MCEFSEESKHLRIYEFAKIKNCGKYKKLEIQKILDFLRKDFESHHH